MKYYNKDEELVKINNLHGSETPQKLPVDWFAWVKGLSEFNEYFIKSYREKNNDGYFLEVDIQYPEYLHKHHDLLFFSDIRKVAATVIYKLNNETAPYMKSSISIFQELLASVEK